MPHEYYFLAFLICLYSPYFVWAMFSLFTLAEDQVFDALTTEPVMGWPLLTVAVPMYNEGDQFIACIDALLSIEYPNLELLVVDDGSTDDSFAIAVDRYNIKPQESKEIWTDGGQSLGIVYSSENYPALKIYRQKNAGKAGALNTALRFANGKYFLTLDADSIPGRFSLKRMVNVLESRSDLIGASGIVRLRNGCEIENGEIKKVTLDKRWLARFQTLEYLRSFLISRIGMSVSGGLIILSGAFAMIRTEDLRSIKGFNQKCIGEDFEVCLRLLQHGKKFERSKLITLSNANCWTSAPETTRVLFRQRERWQRGCFETLWTQRRLFLSTENFRLSWMCLPAFVIFEASTPVYELYGFGFIAYKLMMASFDWNAAFIIISSVMVLNIAASLIALLSETMRPGKPAEMKDIFVLIIAAFLDPILYRPINALPRITGTVKFIFSTQQVWGDMERSKKN